MYSLIADFIIALTLTALAAWIINSATATQISPAEGIILVFSIFAAAHIVQERLAKKPESQDDSHGG